MEEKSYVRQVHETIVSLTGGFHTLGAHLSVRHDGLMCLAHEIPSPWRSAKMLHKQKEIFESFLYIIFLLLFF